MACAEGGAEELRASVASQGHQDYGLIGLR
jgi:hypothetical protein